MLNRDQLQELGRFKLLMRRACQETVHIEQFLTDRSYQSQMLDMAEDQDEDELLLMLAVTLRGRLGRLGEGEEAFTQICPKVIPAEAEASVPDLPIASVAVQQDVTVLTADIESVVLKEEVMPDRIAVRTRSMLSNLFATSANRTSTASNSVAQDSIPRYVNSLR